MLHDRVTIQTTECSGQLRFSEERRISDPIEVLWDGGGAVAVDKPAGLATQAPPGIDSLEVRLRSQFKDRTDYVAFPHRLDRPVSGVILVALRKRFARLLSAQFETRKVQKVYVAQVAGRYDEAPSEWVDHLRKVEDAAKVELVGKDEDSAREARTSVEVIRFDEAQNCTWLRLSPVTGRMHQLRIQTASRGHPIIGDQLYGDSRSENRLEMSLPPDSSRQPNTSEAPEKIELRAASIRFFDPLNSRPVTVTASDNGAESV